MSNKQSAKKKEDEMVTHTDDPLLSLSEVGRMVGKSHTTIRRWVVEGLLKPVRDPSGLSRIRKSVVEAFYSATALAEVAAEKEERAKAAQQEARRRQAEADRANDERLAQLDAERRILEGKGEASREDIQARRMRQYEESKNNGKADIHRDSPGESPD